MNAPRNYGSDRVRAAPDGSLVLSCRHEKGWVARREQDLVHATFPGTCIRWDERLFEVVAMEVLTVGIRYRLLPWDDRHVMRTVEDYDQASERRREEERSREQKRRAVRGVSPLLALVLGNLPAEVQERLGSEYGMHASRLTLIALVPWLVIGTASLILLTASFFTGAFYGKDADVPVPLLFAGTYFFFESLVRLDFSLRQSRPAGSILGIVPWFAYAALTGQARRPPPRLDITPDPSVFQRDAYTLREPLLALLPPPEQRLLAERYGFDPTRWGRRTAVFLLFFSTAGLATSITGVLTQPYFGNLASFLAAAYLFAEQMARLRRIRRGEPAGSILGVLARPVTRRLLA